MHAGSFCDETTYTRETYKRYFPVLEGAAWKSVFGTPMTSDHTEFKQFQEKWPTLKSCKEQFKKLQIEDRKQISLKEESVSFHKMVLNEGKNLFLQGMCRNYPNTIGRNSVPAVA
ncbi:hypothetical protein AVEN_251418-1 [Araneus ventricosus]|uniref:Uncharacterized protein n=1 Tax=Araneus ventricosus TaxID=182803 RepID=A0A4Y2MLD0_ARAVE|nr:hypothetical protein AVEN_251418-1 [Araneus ventricosus]